jgi:hypothetical protein
MATVVNRRHIAYSMLVEAHVASYPICIGDLSAQIMWPEREADYSPPSSAEVKNARSYTTTPTA